VRKTFDLMFVLLYICKVHFAICKASQSGSHILWCVCVCLVRCLCEQTVDKACKSCCPTAHLHFPLPLNTAAMCVSVCLCVCRCLSMWMDTHTQVHQTSSKQQEDEKQFEFALLPGCCSRYHYTYTHTHTYTQVILIQIYIDREMRSMKEGGQQSTGRCK
jgi:hypothetical protein